jgi:peptidoglycan/LPS O-acetylase OafA/YrhL
VALQFDFYNIAMFYLHPGIPLALLLEAFLLFFLLRRWIRFELVVGHAPIIDGLRGFLAFGVFVHHASIWYYFLQHGSWVVPESRLYTHLGQSTVTVFFMITGFLFYGKVLESKKNNIDWLRLYVSRCLRILPLFLLVMLSGALVIA